MSPEFQFPDEKLRYDSTTWTMIAAPLPDDVISWRQDGRAVNGRGGLVARFVPYIDAQFVRHRLDQVVPGNWHLDVEVLDVAEHNTEQGDPDRDVYCKATLRILGVCRSCVGAGQDYKAAATDAFKRAAVRFGIGAQLYDMGQTWVKVDSDSKFAKPIENPSEVYARTQGKEHAAAQASGTVPSTRVPSPASTEADKPRQSASAAPSPRDPLTGADDVPSCPKCGSAMWDNRKDKRNPKAPDFKCKKDGNHAIWLDAQKKPAAVAAAAGEIDDTQYPFGQGEEEQDDLPF